MHGQIRHTVLQMKTLIIIILLTIASCSAISYRFFYSGEIGKSDKELEKVTEKGTLIVDALEEFKKNNGAYPIKLDLMYPKYISKDVNLVYKFHYLCGDQAREGLFTSEEVDAWGGYKLVLSNAIKEWSVPLGRSYSIFVYYPSKLYPERKWTKPIKRVNDWALIVRYRRYRSKGNPIIGPGV